MKIESEAIVATTRQWIGTPYIHQASKLGVGTDCLGLLRGVWRALYGTEPQEVPPYSMDWSETQGQESLWHAAQLHLLEKAPRAVEPGDVLLFRMRDGSVAKHLGILAQVGPAPSFVHAYSRFGVVESPLSMPWQRRVAASFEFPREVS